MLLLQKLIQSQPSRIINVTNISYKRGQIDFNDINFTKRPFDWEQAYNQSHLALVLFTKKLAQLLKDTDVIAIAVHPGIKNMKFSHYFNDTEPGGVRNFFATPYHSIKTVNAKRASQPINYLSASRKVQIKENNGEFYRLLNFEIDNLVWFFSFWNWLILLFSIKDFEDVAPIAEDKELADRLWKLSVDLTQLRSQIDLSGKSQLSIPESTNNTNAKQVVGEKSWDYLLKSM